MGIMDGLTGLEKVFKEKFSKAKVSRRWRAQIHVTRNVLAKAPKELKHAFADDMRSILYAPTKEKAMEFFSELRGGGRKIFLVR